MTFTIRTACPSDIAAMHNLRTRVRENRLSDAARITEQSYVPYIEARSAWVAESKSNLVGFAACDRTSETVWALFTDPDREGSRIGRALHDRMIDWARTGGITILRLATETGTRAAAFYKQAGWIEAGRTGDNELLFELGLIDASCD